MKLRMLLEELEDSLPNGFHDARLEAIMMDYVSRKAVMKMKLHVGTPEAVTKQEKEAYKPAELHLSDVLYFVIGSPDSRYKYGEKGTLWLRAGRADGEAAPVPPIPLEQLPADASAYWFFVNDWNSFIHVAALKASLQWV